MLQGVDLERSSGDSGFKELTSSDMVPKVIKKQAASTKQMLAALRKMKKKKEDEEKAEQKKDAERIANNRDKNAFYKDLKQRWKRKLRTGQETEPIWSQAFLALADRTAHAQGRPQRPEEWS